MTYCSSTPAAVATPIGVCSPVRPRHPPFSAALTTDWPVPADPLTVLAAVTCLFPITAKCLLVTRDGGWVVAAWTVSLSLRHSFFRWRALPRILKRVWWL